MLRLQNIVKQYEAGENAVTALKGVSVTFPRQQFVAVLGPSGCGKTTLLNIIGGLDGYTEGDLFIRGRSTKEFRDADWDAYRNHSVGFVFQSYNLIAHQSVLANVELALTLSGVSRSERRRRAVEALTRVGLQNQLHKKPNQMSGGQMQRVAIARALVNNPDILLADEPTGALDSETSLQIMEILKEISASRLVIMVTHNPELAERYATRILRLKDGEIISDSAPCEAEEAFEEPKKPKTRRARRAERSSMSFVTALSLSFHNLLTKKARTILTAFAGSIGIIGIALILAMSSGIRAYIANVEEDTLSNYPLTLEETSVDFTAMMDEMMNNTKPPEHPLDQIYSNNVLSQMGNTMVQGITRNNLEDFKTYLEQHEGELQDCVSDIQYQYATTLNLYRETDDGLQQVNPNDIMERMGYSDTMTQMASATPMNNNVWQQLLNNDALLEKQYDVLAGRMPQNPHEVVLVVDENNEISDYALYSLGLMDPEQVNKIRDSALNGEDYTVEPTHYTYDQLLALRFRLLPNTAYFVRQSGEDSNVWVDKSADSDFVERTVKEQGIEISVCGILRPAEDVATASVTGAVGYTGGLMTELIGLVNDSEIVKEQKAHPDVDLFTGLPFPEEGEKAEQVVFASIADVQAYIAGLPTAEQAEPAARLQQMQQSGMEEAEIVSVFQSSVNSRITTATYDGNLARMGVSEIDRPSAIAIYPRDFESKDVITDFIARYNDDVEEADRIQYTDYIGLMMSSVTTIINAISYILIAFVAVSLVVSSIMIGIITYISVLERTREIGVLRAIGASKRDISRVFNAETLIIGFVAGALGIGITLLLTIPINLIIQHLTDIAGAAKLPVLGGVILVLISMLLTLIAGVIPSRIAAKKDPVVALRSE